MTANGSNVIPLELVFLQEKNTFSKQDEWHFNLWAAV